MNDDPPADGRRRRHHCVNFPAMISFLVFALRHCDGKYVCAQGSEACRYDEARV